MTYKRLMIPNPFTPRATADYPVGRERTLDDIEQVLSPVLHSGFPAPGGIVLFGVRGIGKTTILRQSSRDAAYSGFIPVWTSAPKSEKFLPLLVDAIKRTLIAGSIINQKEWSLEKFGIEIGSGFLRTKVDLAKNERVQWTTANIETLLRETTRLCKNHGNNSGVGMLLYIDELHSISQSELSILLNCFQNIADDKLDPLPFGFLGAGLPSVKGIATKAATFGERTLFTEIGLLSENDSENVILSILEAQNVGIDSQALRLLVENSHGFPFFLQLYGFNLWKLSKPMPGEEISLAQAIEAIRITENDKQQLFDSRLDAATAVEKEFIIALAQSGGDGDVLRSDIARQLGKTTTDISMVRRQLIGKAVITEAARGYVRFTVPGFASFILNEIG
jgi:hypothetical protein